MDASTPCTSALRSRCRDGSTIDSTWPARSAPFRVRGRWFCTNEAAAGQHGDRGGAAHSSARVVHRWNGAVREGHVRLLHAQENRVLGRTATGVAAGRELL